MYVQGGPTISSVRTVFFTSSHTSYTGWASITDVYRVGQQCGSFVQGGPVSDVYRVDQ